MSATQFASAYTSRDHAIAVAQRTFSSGRSLPYGEPVREVLVRDGDGVVIYGRRVSSRVGR